MINDAIKKYPPLFGRFIIPDQHHKLYAYKSTLIINMSASLEPQTVEKPSAAKVSDFICLEIDECIAYRQGFSDSVGVIVGQVLEGVLVEPLDELERLDTTFKVKVYRKAKHYKQIVVNKSCVIQNIVILYKNQLDNGLPLTGTERYGGIIVFEGLADVCIFESNETPVDDRFMMPLYLRACLKSSIDKAILSAQSKNWDISAFTMYLIKSRLIVSIYQSLRTSIVGREYGTNFCNGSFSNTNLRFMTLFFCLLLERCGGAVVKVANSSGSSNKFSIACPLVRTGDSICQDTSFTSRSIYIEVPESRLTDLVSVLGEGVRRQFKPGNSSSSIYKAPFIYVKGDIRFELCFLQMKIGYRFNVEYHQTAGSSGKADNTAHVLSETVHHVNLHYTCSRYPQTIFEFIRFERFPVMDVAVLANASLIVDSHILEIKNYKKTFKGSHYEENGNIVVVPKEQFSNIFILAKPMHGLLLFEPGLVNNSKPENSFWLGCIMNFHKNPRSESIAADLLSETRTWTVKHASRTILNETLAILKLDLLDDTISNYLESFCEKIQTEYYDCNIRTESGGAKKRQKPARYLN